MDYFALFSLPVSLLVDQSKVLTAYYRLSQQYHPDRLGANASADDLQRSASINRAKTVLDDPMRRLEYLLKQNGYLPDDEKYQLPPLFLSDMMDLNESLMEARLENDAEKLKALQGDIETLDKQLWQPVSVYFQQHILEADAEAWDKLKLYYYQHKYLMRLVSPNHDM